MKIPYTYPHRSRAAKVDYICSIGGYFCRDGHWPIEFNVAAYSAKLDFDSLYAGITERGESSFDDTPAFKEACRSAYEECKDNLWYWAQEDCYRSLHDDDAYKMLWDGTPVDVKFGLYGRGGKHLVIEEFEGLHLRKFDEDDLRRMLMQQGNGYARLDDRATLRKGYEWYVSPSLVDRLYKYCRQCAVDFTPEKAGEALQDAAAGSLMTRGEIAMEEQQKRLSVQADMEAKAMLLYDAIEMSDEEVKAAFRDLCIAAGLSPSDIMY